MKTATAERREPFSVIVSRGLWRGYDVMIDVNRRPIGTPYQRAKGTPCGCVDGVMLGAGFALLAA